MKQMKKLQHFLAIVLVLTVSGLCSLSCRKVGPEPEKTYGLTVFVTDESAAPVQDALVTVDSIEKRTDAAGKCTFTDMKARHVVVKVSAYAYLPVTQSVTLTGEPGQTLKVSLTKEPPYLSVDLAEIVTRELESKQTLQIQSNTAWRIESSSDVLVFSPQEGNGDQTVSVSWSFPEEQEDEDVALAEFTILSAVDPVTVPVRCLLPIRVLKTEGFAVNLARDDSASSIARVTFSRKVLPLEAWAPGYYELGVRSVDDHTVDVVIPGNYVSLGESYVIEHLKVESANEDGVAFDKKVIVDFFDDKVEIEGVMKQWSLTKDETRIWVSAEFPNRIYELDARSFEVLKSFDLDWEPGKLQLNPYNGRLYVVDHTNRVLKVLDPASGKTVKTIKLEPDEQDDPDGPITIPCNILFADNGLGVLIATATYLSDAYRWFFIDSRRDDKLEENPLEKEFGWGNDYCFTEMFLDHSRTKIIGSPLEYLNQRTFIIDCSNKSVSHFEVANDFGAPGVEDAGGSIMQQRPHKEKDRMLFRAPYSVVVYDYANAAYEQVFTGDLRWSFFDFCYGSLAGDDICTYWFTGSPASIGISWQLLILDHSAHTVPFAANLQFDGSYAQDAISFLEGDRLVLASTDGNGKTFFVTLDTSRFTP